MHLCYTSACVHVLRTLTFRTRSITLDTSFTSLITVITRLTFTNAGATVDKQVCCTTTSILVNIKISTISCTSLLILFKHQNWYWWYIFGLKIVSIDTSTCVLQSSARLCLLRVSLQWPTVIRRWPMVIRQRGVVIWQWEHHKVEPHLC